MPVLSSEKISCVQRSQKKNFYLLRALDLQNQEEAMAQFQLTTQNFHPLNGINTRLKHNQQFISHTKIPEVLLV